MCVGKLAAPQQSQWRLALQLLRAGLRTRSIVPLEAVAELLTPPLSLLVAACLLICVASLLLWFPLAMLGRSLLAWRCLLHSDRLLSITSLHRQFTKPFCMHPVLCCGNYGSSLSLAGVGNIRRNGYVLRVHPDRGIF